MKSMVAEANKTVFRISNLQLIGQLGVPAHSPAAM
jgi:hypothetical protein